MKKKIFQNNYPNLHIIPTPIGNLGDISLRVIESLEKVSILCCEDTRKTGNLLKKLNIKNKPKLIRFDLVKENFKVKQILLLFEKHHDIGLVSDAGTPLISDPGFPLVRDIAKLDINIVSLPGPVAYLIALTICGFPINNHYFYGFLPPKNGQRMKLYNQLLNFKTILVFYVWCYKIKKVLKELMEMNPLLEVFVAKELTKLYETHYRGYVEKIIHDIPENPKGEYVLIINNR